MSDSKQQQGPEQIREMIAGFQRARVILSAYELGIFSILGGEGMKAEDVARLCGTDPRATDRLMNALCAAGLLEKSGDYFSNAPLSAKFLDRKSPDYLEGLAHMSHLWESWSTLTEAVRKGSSVRGEHVNSWTEEQVRSFIGAMNDRAKRQAPALAAMIDLTGVRRLLDVGGGSGAFSIAMARANPDLHAVILDLPDVTPITREYIAREGLSGRVTTADGDYDRDEFGTGFDMALLSAVIHSNSIEQNRALMARCARALVPGGRIVVQDFIMDESRTRPAHGAFFALNMLVNTRFGDTFTAGEVRSWLEDAGFGDIAFSETPFGTGLVTAAKK